MTKYPIEVITSVERRRRWSREDKERLVAACIAPGAVLSEIARAAGIHVSQLFRWPKERELRANHPISAYKNPGWQWGVGSTITAPSVVAYDRPIF